MISLACVVLVFWLFWGPTVYSRVFFGDPKAVRLVNTVQFFDKKTPTINFTIRYM